MFEFESGQRESAFERTCSGFSREACGYGVRRDTHDRVPNARATGLGAGRTTHQPDRRDDGVTTLMKIYFFPDNRLCKLIFIYLAKPFA
ncbi:hypothetical protein EIB72_20445 [Burkholderia ambifaria]|uniref:hypothetical protein n=1 Tax=Burkholderia ambifaria TaxID=152480 RepID=UPI0013FD48A9|nr:hypothetical protein [Burkholderia ambifaria]NHL68756.1 hypothetical protein [Burkholderia ambifaria]